MRSAFTFRLATLLLLLISHLSVSSSAQCTSNFQFAYNAGTDEIEFSQHCTYDSTITPILFMWDFGDGTTSVEENPSHHYAAGNNYLVCLYLYVGNGLNCCQDTFCEIIDFVPAGIPDVTNNLEFSVYSRDQQVSVMLSLAREQFLKISLLTLSGYCIPVRTNSKLFAGSTEIQFELPDYPPGIYFIRIEDEYGNLSGKRFILN